MKLCLSVQNLVFNTFVTFWTHTTWWVYHFWSYFETTLLKIQTLNYHIFWKEQGRTKKLYRWMSRDKIFVMTSSFRHSDVCRYNMASFWRISYFLADLALHRGLIPKYYLNSFAFICILFLSVGSTPLAASLYTILKMCVTLHKVDIFLPKSFLEC